jgi:ribosomal protein L44E
MQKSRFERNLNHFLQTPKGYKMSMMTQAQPSKERGCEGKANFGRNYEAQAERIAKKHGKRNGVYSCPHCGGTHLTTKLSKADRYLIPLLYVTGCAGEA